MGVFDKTAEDIEHIVNTRYDKNYLVQGQKGVARFTYSHILKPTDNESPVYIITDYNRANGKYKLVTGEVVNDLGMIGLTRKIQPSIKRKATNIMSEENIDNQTLFKKYQEVYNMEDNNTLFCRELVRIIEIDKTNI